MPRHLSDAVAVLRWEQAIEESCMSVFRQWAPEVEAAVLPELPVLASLIASAPNDSDLPPQPEAIQNTTSLWEMLLASKIMPGVERLTLGRIATRMRASGTDKQARTLYDASGKNRPLTTIYGDKRSRDARVVYALPSQRQWQANYLDAVRNRMTSTPDTVFRDIASAIREGTSKGESIPKLRARVHTLLRGNNLAMWRNRAVTIARTEAIGAFNGATLRAALTQATLLGQDIEKVWVATIDGRTRRSHFRADGQRRPLDGKFQVGRADLDHPGDPRGPAAEVINCRCTIIEVEAGDALPGEDDRQTERGPGDATVRNRRGSRQDEIDRRAADGVVRARDEDDGITAAATGGAAMPTQWNGVLAPLGKPTGDGRMFADDMKVSFRDFPLPLMWQQQTSDFPHSQAYTVGSIREASIDGGVISASGVLFDTDEAQEAIAQLAEGVTRPSVDLCDDTWELRDGDGNLVDPETMWDLPEEELAELVMCFTAATVMGATLVAKPAFAEAKITVDGAPDPDDSTDTDEPPVEEPDGEASVQGAEFAAVKHAGKSGNTPDSTPAKTPAADQEKGTEPDGEGSGDAPAKGKPKTDTTSPTATGKPNPEDAKDAKVITEGVDDEGHGRPVPNQEADGSDVGTSDDEDDTSSDDEDGGDGSGGGKKAPPFKKGAKASITEAEQAMLTASVVSLRPSFDPALFANPGLTEPTRLKHDPATGRVWGHVATWGVCHLGVQGKCIMAPQSQQQYAQFHTHEVDTDSGPLAVGVLSYGAGHASPTAGVRAALEHYDNAATSWAFVCAGEDEAGIWISGVVSPFASKETVAMALTAPLSGDWRRVGGSLEMCAALSVNTPGFHPAGAHDEMGRPTSMVAAGVLPAPEPSTPRALEAKVEQMVASILSRRERVDRLAAARGVDEYTNDRRARALALKNRRR